MSSGVKLISNQMPPYKVVEKFLLERRFVTFLPKHWAIMLTLTFTKDQFLLKFSALNLHPKMWLKCTKIANFVS